MKNKIFSKRVFKNALIVFLCGILFFGIAYAYLNYNIDKAAADADQKDYTVPYENLPENTGVAFLLPDGSAVMAYLDFENKCINVVNIESYDSGNNLYYGYTADFTVKINYQLIGGIVDRVGGIDIETNGETLRYTGVQIIDLISTDNSTDIKSQIISEIFNSFSKNPFSKDDFVFIMENSESNLTIIDCIYWLDYIDEISNRINFVN